MNDRPTTRRICILGATSGMAVETARLLAREGHHLVLVGRVRERLLALRDDMTARGAGTVRVLVGDLVTDTDADALLAGARDELGSLDSVLMFHGRLADQGMLTSDPHALAETVETNFTSAARLAFAAVRLLESSTHPRPVLLAIGSVAGDRGRASNYVYGAGKAALATLLQGMAHECAVGRRKTRVVVVKAGLTRTPMTEAFDREGPLWASAGTLARAIVAAMRGDRAVVYAPRFWRPIMLVVRNLPQGVMHRLDF